jgi:RNA polymerase sigma-70 factor, ECF subfamily
VLPEDSIVVSALRSDDEKMFEQVFRHYYSVLCNYALGIVHDKDDAEDIVQQTMIVIWEKRSLLQITVSLKSYLYRAVHNSALNKIRNSKVKAIYAEEQLTLGQNDFDSASEYIVGKELNEQIVSSINQLPEQCRLVFKLSRFEQMKYAEIASHLDISVKTVENHMGKALRLLRNHLKDYLMWLLIIMTKYL